MSLLVDPWERRWRECGTQMGAHTGGSAFAMAVPRVSVQAKAGRNNVVCMSAATDEIVEKLKTLSVRKQAEQRTKEGGTCFGRG